MSPFPALSPFPASTMKDALTAVGIGPYELDRCNELPEPNTGGSVWERTDTSGTYRRLARGGGADTNNWQGVCKSANGAVAYSVQGAHMSEYRIMNNAPSRVAGSTESQPTDNVHAFNWYHWLRETDGALHPTWRPPTVPATDSSTSDAR